jgi:hypothetical protein
MLRLLNYRIQKVGNVMSFPTSTRNAFAFVLGFIALGAAAQQTVLTYQSTSSQDWIGQGASRAISSTDATFTPYLESDNGGPVGTHLRIRVEAASGDYELALAGHSTSAPNAYEAAAKAQFRGASPGLDFSGEGRHCNLVLGRFNILEIEIGAGPSLTRFAANFEQRCEIDGPPLYGEIRYNSSVPLSSAQPPGDTTPDIFRLEPQDFHAPAGTTLTSWRTSVYGINAPAPISIIGGEYSINGGVFTANAGTVSNRDTVVVRMQSSATPGGTALAKLSVGDVSAFFIAHTYQPGTPLTAFHFRSPDGDWVGQGEEKLYVGPPNIINRLPTGSNSLLIDLKAVGGSYWTLIFGAPNDAVLAPGRYVGATSHVVGDAPQLYVSGEHRGCNTVSGEFTVHEVVYDAGGNPTSFSADFVQSCEGVMPPMRGTIRLNSAYPFPPLQSQPQSLPCITSEDFRRDGDGDSLPDCVEESVARDPNVKDNDVFNDARLFVMQLYRDVLGREGDSDGITYWQSQVVTLGRAEMVRTFLRTPEFLENIAPVARLYLAYFLRAPDYQGLQFWSGQKREGSALESISRFFAGSAEFEQRYGGLSNAAFVDLVYANVLGRVADAGGRAFWIAQLDGGLSRGALMLQFSESSEFRATSGVEVYVAMTYHSMLRRTADPAGFGFWVDYVDAGNPETALISGFLGAQEYRRRFLP